ncbi:MAG TPA: hypothetical protein VGW78_05265 [Candidatus Babeliales bacterium]|jgi:hypothetical protein|nr:hypothetical protein [Candidatus Babeliales bacterium]
MHDILKIQLGIVDEQDYYQTLNRRDNFSKKYFKGDNNNGWQKAQFAAANIVYLLTDEGISPLALPNQPSEKNLDTSYKERRHRTDIFQCRAKKYIDEIKNCLNFVKNQTQKNHIVLLDSDKQAIRRLYNFLNDIPKINYELYLYTKNNCLYGYTAVSNIHTISQESLNKPFFQKLKKICNTTIEDCIEQDTAYDIYIAGPQSTIIQYKDESITTMPNNIIETYKPVKEKTNLNIHTNNNTAILLLEEKKSYENTYMLSPAYEEYCQRYIRRYTEPYAYVLPFKNEDKIHVTNIPTYQEVSPLALICIDNKDQAHTINALSEPRKKTLEHYIQTRKNNESYCLDIKQLYIDKNGIAHHTTKMKSTIWPDEQQSTYKKKLTPVLSQVHWQASYTTWQQLFKKNQFHHIEIPKLYVKIPEL